MQQSVSLFYREGSSDKEYHVRMEPIGDKFIVNIAYGRRGSTLSTGTKTQSPVDVQQATRIFSKLVNEKKAKGYTEGVAGTPYQHSEKQSSGIQCQLLNPVEEEEASQLMSDDRWCMQEKHDGRRMLVQRKDAAIHGINRKGLLAGLPDSMFQEVRQLNYCILDGEAVGDVLFVFDLLEVNGYCIRALPYQERLNQLSDLLEPFEFKHLVMVETAYQCIDKLTLLQRLKQDRREGVVFKRLDAPYTAGRPHSGGSQLKHKFYATASAVVIKSNQQRSVEIGLLNNEGWQSAGNVTIPVNHQVPKVGTVVEVRYLYAFSESGSLYQPTYLGQRDDIQAIECLRSQLKFKAGEDDES